MTTTIVHDHRTPAERRYDALKDGSAYAKDDLTPLAETIAAQEQCAMEIARQVAGEMLGHLERVAAPPIPPQNPSPLLVDLVAWADQEMRAEQPALHTKRHTHYSDTGLPYKDAWTTYTLGDASIDRYDSGRIPNICIGKEMLEIEDNQQVRDLMTLLVEAERTPAPAVRTEYWYHNPDEGGDLTEEPCGPLGWVDYICGEGESRARISFCATDGPFTVSTSIAGMGVDISIEAIEQTIANMHAVLADPRVRAARVRMDAGGALRVAASSPETRAIYDAMSPEAQRVADKLLGILDRMPEHAADAAADSITAILEAIDGGESPVLDWETARQRALVEWQGTTEFVRSGALHRSPELPEVEIAQLEDGTPVMGDFDTDDAALTVCAEWQGFRIRACADGLDFGDDEEEKDYYHLTIPQYARLKNLIMTGVLDQMLVFGKAWDAQRELASAPVTT